MKDLSRNTRRPNLLPMSKAEILAELPRLQPEEREEIFARLCDLQEMAQSKVHQQWVDEALASGEARPASQQDWDDALQRGLSRATKRG
jgi:hypothetical protein